MILLSQLLKAAQVAFPKQVTFRYSHPNLYLVCTTAEFGNLTQEARLESFAKALSLQASEIAEVVAGSTLQLVLATPEERDRDYAFLNDAKAGHHWIEFFASFVPTVPQRPLLPGDPRSIHFYGFKGGQGRSTILALLAKQMADDGYRVLAVDADLEAPSLDLLLAATASAPSATLLGYGPTLDHFRPLSAYTPRQGPGVVDLIPCRPAGEAYDLDFAAFVLRSSLDVLLPEEIAGKIHEDATEQKYDIILFDHRSGLSTSILPILSACPGPVAISLRLDDQSSAATGFFDILLRQNVDYPGLFISFSLDPDDTLEKMRSRNPLQIDALLACLSDALARGALPPDDSGQLELPLTPDDLSDYWVPWFHDRALLSGHLPTPTDLSKNNLASLQQIRSVIGFAAKKEIPNRIARPSSPPALTASGGTDEGLFIETEALRKLLPANTPHTYIFGRKGTGKTRLLRELATRRQGEPLVVASDFKDETGIPSGNETFKDLSDSFDPDPEKFWWAILASALSLPAFTTRDSLLKSLKQYSQRARAEGPASVRITEIVDMAARQEARRVFLVDGIETAFLSSRLILYLEGLFKFLSSIQSNPKLQDKVTIRLFLRTDLARRAFQNIEQQISGRVIYLSWDTQSILNFVLSRITALPWFVQAFPSTVAELQSNQQLLVAGNLPVDECDRLLTQVFPQKIRRNNLLTLTFLKTYFSGSAGEAATYYPRIYDRFLHLIDNPTGLDRQFASVQKLEEGRVSQALIFAAHEQAAKDYLEQVEAELVYLLQLAPDYATNAQRVKELLQAFAGLSTPFVVDSCLQQLGSKLQGVSEPQIRAALLQMREVGIFEERPGFANQWRVGRLFKASLGMKYVRSQRAV
jgi:Mrp family chromosome partitioning ATPase